MKLYALLFSLIGLIIFAKAQNIVPISYQLNEKFVVKCAACNNEIGHGDHNHLEIPDDLFFKVEHEATAEKDGVHICPVCQSELFEETDQVLSADGWNVFKQNPDANYLIEKINPADLNSHISQCVICSEKDLFAWGLHFNLPRNQK